MNSWTKPGAICSNLVDRAGFAATPLRAVRLQRKPDQSTMTVPLFDALQTYEELDGISRRSPLSDALPAALCSRALNGDRLSPNVMVRESGW